MQSAFTAAGAAVTANTISAAGASTALTSAPLDPTAAATTLTAAAFTAPIKHDLCAHALLPRHQSRRLGEQ